MAMASIEIRDAADADALRAAWTLVQQLRPEIDYQREAFRFGIALD